MSMGVHHPYQLDLCADDEDPSQWIIRPEWDAPHVRCFPRTFCAWPCLLRQVGTVLGSPYDCVVASLAYAKPRVPTYTLQAEAAEDLKITETYQLSGADTSITFSQSDHPPAVPRPGHAPLVLEAQIGGYDMDRVFVDGGSSLNIIFTSTLRKMSIPRSVWKNSGITIYGVVPGESTSSIGTIELDVIFSSKRNFAKQALEFEVLDWQSQYHTILRRPAFAEFMVVPHYAY